MIRWVLVLVEVVITLIYLPRSPAFATEAPGNSPTARVSKVYLDSNKNVHVVENGRDIKITSEGKFSDPKLSPDSQTVGWLVTSHIEVEKRDSVTTIDVEEELIIYRNGQVVRSIKPGGFIRSWGFWQKGEQVAIYSGALHFAGFYVLYDVGSGREIARGNDPITEDSPNWMRSLE